MATDSQDAITEENTAPDAAPADQEVGETDVNFTTAAGTPEAPASSSDGTESDLTDSTTSPSADPTQTPEADPLASGATEDSFGAPDVNKNDSGSDSATSTDPESEEDATEGDEDEEEDETEDDEDDGYADAPEAHKALRGEHAEGHGPSHIGTDTPDRLISNPFNEDTGLPLFPKDTHSDVPLEPGHFDKKDDNASPQAKLSQALELLGEVQAGLA